MATRKAYLAEPQILTAPAIITALIEGEKKIVRLDQTYFHPQGGGQKGDRGFIGAVAVLDTKHAEAGEVDHFVAGFDGLTVGQSVILRIDEAGRRLNAVNHSAGHLIAALADKAFPSTKAVQGHHWPGEARVECEGEISDDLISRMNAFLQPALDRAIAEQWPVAIVGDPFVNRAIQFGDAAAVPCGGTHIAHLGQIKNIAIKSIKKKGDRLRITYDAAVNDAAF